MRPRLPRPRALAGFLLAGALLPLLEPRAARAGGNDCADAWITAKLKTRLMGKRGLGAFKIDIDTEGCVVTLNGCVETQEQKQEAARVAAKVKRVRAVRNRLTLCDARGRKGARKGGEGADECADALITAEVKTLILGTEGLAAFKIDIDTEGCVVTLNGCVETQDQKQAAIRAARKAKGVAGVRSRLTICPAG